MNKICCECRHWNDKGNDYNVCLRWAVSMVTGRLVPRESHSGTTFYTPMGYGCNAFEEKLKGPFYADRCCAIDEHEWAVGILPGHILIDHIPKIRAQRLSELLNAYWLERKDNE